MVNRHEVTRHEHVQSRPGESSAFHFESLWRVNAPIERVWSVLADVDSWPTWWPGLPAAESLDEVLAPGSRAQLEVRSPIGLRLNFGIALDDIAPPGFVSFTADGDLRGIGVWTLEQIGPITTISSTWCVTSARTLIRMVRPVSAMMHAYVMRAGHRGLARRLRS